MPSKSIHRAILSLQTSVKYMMEMNLIKIEYLESKYHVTVYRKDDRITIDINPLPEKGG